MQCHTHTKTSMYRKFVKCPYRMQILNHWVQCSVKDCMKFRGMCYLLSGRYNALWKQNTILNERVFYYILKSELKKKK